VAVLHRRPGSGGLALLVPYGAGTRAGFTAGTLRVVADRANLGFPLREMRMRGTGARVSGLIVLAFVATSCTAKTAATAAGDINVHLTCTPSGNVEFSLNRWSLHRQKGETVTWHLVASSVAAVSIEAKDPITWQITPPPPYTVGGNSPAAATVSADAASGRHSYTIIGICPGSGGVPDTVTIDPDIVVD
jgi:hypothetical protein